MPQSTWTHDRDAALARYYMAGDPVDRIASVLECTVSMITTRVSTLGLRRRKLKREEGSAGNDAWVIGAAIRANLPVDHTPFAEDLLNQLR